MSLMMSTPDEPDDDTLDEPDEHTIDEPDHHYVNILLTSPTNQ